MTDVARGETSTVSSWRVLFKTVGLMRCVVLTSGVVLHSLFMKYEELLQKLVTLGLSYEPRV